MALAFKNKGLVNPLSPVVQEAVQVMAALRNSYWATNAFFAVQIGRLAGALGPQFP